MLTPTNACVFHFLNLGERTFGVLTKIDLMDKGTDAVDVIKLSLIWILSVVEELMIISVSFT